MVPLRSVLGVFLIVTGLISLLATSIWAQEGSQRVYVATISGSIDLGMTPYIKRTLRKATDSTNSTVVLDINTPGGRLDAAFEIKDSLLETEVPVLSLIHI